MKHLSLYSLQGLNVARKSIEDEISYRRASLLPSIPCQISSLMIAVDKETIYLLDGDKRNVLTCSVSMENFKTLLTKAFSEAYGCFLPPHPVRTSSIVIEVSQDDSEGVWLVDMRLFDSSHQSRRVVVYYQELMTLVIRSLEGEPIYRRTTHPESKFPAREAKHRNYRKLRKLLSAIKAEQARRADLLNQADNMPTVGNYQYLALGNDYAIFIDSEGHADKISLGAKQLLEICTLLPDTQEQCYEFGEDRLSFMRKPAGFANTVVRVHYLKTGVPAFLNIERLTQAVQHITQDA